MKFGFKMIWVCLVFVWALVLSSLTGCKKSVQSIVASAENSGETLNVSSDEATDPDEIVDCDDSICGKDIEVVSYVPDVDVLEMLAKNETKDSGMIALTGEVAGNAVDVDHALNQMRSFDQLATSVDSSPVLANAVSATFNSFLRDFVGGDTASREKILNGLKSVVSEARPILEKSSLNQDERTRLKKLALVLTGQEFSQSPLAKIIKSRFNAEATPDSPDLGDQLSFASDALHFFDNNISGSTLGRKLEVIERMLNFAQDIARVATGEKQNENVDGKKAKIVLAAAAQFAGKDGFINRGDIHRLTSVFQRLVSKIADQKIAEGYAQGISKLRSEHPFVYRRWVRRPNGLIGRAVNRGIAKEMSSAHSQKMRAIAQATQQSSMLYEAAMRSLGVQRYYLGNDRQAKYVDPGPEMTLQMVESVIVAITGKSSRQLADGGTGGISKGIDSEIQKLLDRVVLPDGVFVSEGLGLVDGSKSLPSGLIFSSTDDGKISIRAYKDACGCERLPDQQQCVVRFTDVSRRNARMQYAFATKDAKGCAVSECDAAFVNAKREVYLPYACAYRYEHKESKVFRIFK